MNNTEKIKMEIVRQCCWQFNKTKFIMTEVYNNIEYPMVFNVVRAIDLNKTVLDVQKHIRNELTDGVKKTNG